MRLQCRGSIDKQYSDCELREMERLLLLVMVMLALSCYMIWPCLCTGLCSSQEFGLSNGAFHFPVFHRKHPCVDKHPSMVHAASVSDAGTVVGNDWLHEGKYFMAISLGTPAVFNLVTIDTGSALSWVHCRRCQIFCQTQWSEAGDPFDPENSTTYHHVGCSDKDCVDIHYHNGLPYGCIEETNTCLYLVQYGSPSQHYYTAGKVGKDRLSLGSNNTIVDDFVFGCSEDDRYVGYEAGIIGFGDKSFSFFNQMARQTSYNAFAYCFPGDHRNEGFLIVGPYPRKPELVTTLIRGYEHRQHAYSVLLLGMAVDGKPLEVDDPSVDIRQLLLVDSGATDTYISSPLFYALAKAMVSAMQGKGYYRLDTSGACFRSRTAAPINWRSLPTVEMQFLRNPLKLPPENVFHQGSADGRMLCLAFSPEQVGVPGVRILGNKALASFMVVYDLEKLIIGFRARAC